MVDFRHKREDADRQFRQGLEELVRGHIDGCMTALASCSSVADDDDGPSAAGGGGEAPDLLARRRRRSDLEGDDLAESSAAARRHSRILSRWVARQAEEMITTIERRNRENELMALAGLHTVSMLDSSFLRESRRAAQSSVERPVAARASSILQRWRELEYEAATAVRDRGSPTVSGNRPGRPEVSRAAERGGTSEDASESDDNEYHRWAQEPLSPAGRRRDAHLVDDDEGRGSSREQSPDLGDGERERVRQIVRGWMTENGIADEASRMSPRAEWLGETERERVRLVRESVQMASQQREARASRRDERGRDGSVTDHEEGQPEHVRRDLPRLRGRQARLDLITRIVRERQRELQGLSEHRAVSDFAHRNRIQSLLRGRFLRNGGSTEEERPPSVAARELGQLRQRHPVTGLREGFRYRLENIVRGQASSHSDASVSHNSNGSRNDQPHHNISGSRNDQYQPSTIVEVSNVNHDSSQITNVNDETNETTEIHEATEVESNTLNDNIDWQESDTQEVSWQEDAEHGRRDWQQSIEVGYSEWHDGTGEESDGNWQEHMDQEWSRETPEDEDGEDSNLLEANEEWHEDDSQENVADWQDGHSDPPRDQESISMRRVNRFIPPDDDNVYSMELRELLSRRSVSNLLRSGFRESLDQLIQSYVQRQGRAPFDWDLQGSMPTASPVEDQAQQRDDLNQDQQETSPRPPLVLPRPPVPPPQPMWHSELHHNHWTRQSIHRSYIEWDMINDLRADMARLQQGMSNMQRMLEACMDMQLELQRSVRQEVSAALNCSSGKGRGGESSEDGSKWGHVRKGTCCVCCDSHIDSLLYRCGHMCACFNCASELVRSGGKCPLCRAPIVEVIRAYSIL
ncbi:uncharacterized protein LOC103716994 [Phoenix dactylifera]|uniref:Uncharacterized protein LOC103716994 n=1 Tax=Phoenix dactylifera TaxID=42345 RepID=A0A8B9A6T1_PHODC|nr:uncharacterized protein LOC103716994 [Phoenix dactylifera]